MLHDFYQSIRSFFNTEPPAWLSVASCITTLATAFPFGMLSLFLLDRRRPAENRPATMGDIRWLFFNLGGSLSDLTNALSTFRTGTISSQRIRNKLAPPGSCSRIHTEESDNSRPIVKTAQFRKNNKVDIDYFIISILFSLMSIFLALSSFYYAFFIFISPNDLDSIYYAIALVYAISFIHMATKLRAICDDKFDTTWFFGNYTQEMQWFVNIDKTRLCSPRVMRRVRMISNNIGDLSSLHELLPAAASLDSGNIENAYTPLSAYAWMLPVLGFIGTARGMVKAIGGFSPAFGKNDKIGDDLGSLLHLITDGLSSAFNTTITALSATIVVYICTRALKHLDQSNLDLLDDSCFEILSLIPISSNDISDEKMLSYTESLKDISRNLEDIANITVYMDEIKIGADAATEKLREMTGSVSNLINSIKDTGAENMHFASKISDSINDLVDIMKTFIYESPGSSPSYNLPYRLFTESSVLIPDPIIQRPTEVKAKTSLTRSNKPSGR